MNFKLPIRDKLLRFLGPTRMIALSFVLVILVGSFLLWLPFSQNPGMRASYLNSLFVATSATCVTGLMPFAVIDQYNLIGQTVIIFLMQIGGLGLMSLLALFLTLMRRKLNFSEKKMLQDSLNKNDADNIPNFLKSIFRYTFIFEAIGMVLLALRFIPEYGLTQGLYNSVFLSVSAFCNAGLDNITRSSLMAYATDPLINFTVCGLIITGGLGFAVWFDLRRVLPEKKKFSWKRLWTRLSLHSRLVLVITGALLGSGTLLILLVEFTNPDTLGWMSFPQKVMAAFFPSTTLRTAGFSTIDFSMLRGASLFIMLFYMIIGGSPGGTAGGIKTTTFSMLFVLIVSEIRDAGNMTLFKRTLPAGTFHKAFAVTLTYACVLIIAIFLLTLSDPEIGFLPIAFEAFSAIATVGLSAGVTPLLSALGKIVIIALMYIGRVGPITIVLSLMRMKQNRKTNNLVYPHGDVLIG